MPRNLSGKVEHLQHYRTFSDDSVKVQIPKQLLLSRFYAMAFIVERCDIV